MSLQLTFQGTGDARRVPVYGCQCPGCVRALKDTAYQRRACSALIEADAWTILLDAGRTDLCETFSPGVIDTILLTHYHMDHVMGLFHLRWGANQSIPVFGPDDAQGCDDLYKHPGILSFQKPLQAFESVAVGPLMITPLPLIHSKPVFGYCIESEGRSIAYLTDTVGLPEDTLAWLQQNPPGVLVLDCSLPPQKKRPRNHNDLSLALELVQLISPGETYLTHVGHQLDAYLIDHPTLPERVRVAQDGQKIHP